MDKGPLRRPGSTPPGKGSKKDKKSKTKVVPTPTKVGEQGAATVDAPSAVPAVTRVTGFMGDARAVGRPNQPSDSQGRARRITSAGLSDPDLAQLLTGKGVDSI